MKNNESGNKKTNLLAVFLLTVAGVVGAGILIFLIYCMVSGIPVSIGKLNLSGDTAAEAAADAETTEVSINDPDEYSGREPISADDPALMQNQPEEEAEAEEEVPEDDGTYKSKYSGVYERFGDDLDDPEYLKANRIVVMDSRDEDVSLVTMTFAGDILFDDEYSVMARLLGNGGEISAGIDQKLIDMMHASDIMMLNNEFPYSYGGSPTPEKTYTFRADPSTVRYLSDMGVNAVGIANNHAFDFGEQAFADTISTLEEAGIPYCGGGRDISEASAPVYFVVDDMKIGVIAATQIERLDNPDTRGATDSQSGVFRCLNPDRLLNKISETKPKCDFLVVFIHWGTESTNEVDWLQTDQAPKIADAGADLIIGAHPHVLQPIGVTKGIPVVYSLGNFWFNSKELDTAMVRFTVDQSGIKSFQFIPCRQVGCRTYPAVGEEHDRILMDMRAMSSGISIDSEGFITY